MTLIKKSIFLILILFISSIEILAKNPVVWRPVSPEELKMDKPKVEPDADAEAIFWEVRLDDKKRKKLSYEHYVRVKIFTERGREKFAKFDIPFFKGKKVEDVAARVIKPDGSIVNLKPQDIFEREIIRQRKLKIRAKSFAVPGIEPGVIVEYKYRETFKNDSANGERLFFQRDIPLQKVSYYVRPYKGMSLEFKPRNMSLGGIHETDDGFSVVSMQNVPAFKEEPRMPPDEEVRRWVYLSYNSFGFNISWFGLVSGYGRYFNKFTNPDKFIKQKAEEITANASSPIEKLKKLYKFSQKQIINTSFDSSNVVRRKPKIKKASDILKYGRGQAGEIDLLFASLARGLHFDVNLAFLGNRNNNFFNPNRDPVSPSYINPGGISIKIDDEWRYFNPGTPYLPFGELLWYEEAVFTMLVNGNWNVWTKTPLTTHDASKGYRKGKFKLTEDGTLEGKVSLEYTGNWANERRREGINKTNEKRQEDFSESLKDWVSTGEFSDVIAENFDTNEKPVAISYSLKIPNYATKTGKRMFFQPAVFQYNQKPEFSSATRVHPIYFKYPWSEVDEIEIQLPKSFSVENYSLPQNVLEKSKLGELKYQVAFDRETNTLIYKRNFYFGGKNKILFPARAYTPLKQLFDLFHKSDSHTFSLKRK